MKLPELYERLQVALAGPLNVDELAFFTRQAKELAAHTKLAPGIIDPTGQACALNIELENRIRALFETEARDTLAALHDALLDLRSAIIQHDEDLTPSKESGQGDVDS